jgi:cysteine synthase A
MAPVRTTGGVVAAAAVISIFFAMLSHLLSSKRTILRLSKKKEKKPRNGLIDAIGNTPLFASTASPKPLVAKYAIKH